MVRRRTIRWFSLAAALHAGAVLSGCKQSEGDRCEVNNDCSGGLTCDNPTGTSGRCSSNPGTMLPVDAAVPAPRLDAVVPDAMRDTAVERDTAVPDVVPDSAGAPDAAPADLAADLASEALPRDALADAVTND